MLECPSAQAACNGDQPSSSILLTSAPCFINSLTAEKLLSKTAWCKAVSPKTSQAQMSISIQGLKKHAANSDYHYFDK